MFVGSVEVGRIPANLVATPEAPAGGSVAEPEESVASDGGSEPGEGDGQSPPEIGRVIDTASEEEHGLPPPANSPGRFDVPYSRKLRFALAALAAVTSWPLAAGIWPRRRIVLFLSAIVSIVSIYSIGLGPTVGTDLEFDIKEASEAAGVDAELVAYLMLTNAFNRRTTRNVQELSRRASAWMAQYRKNWSYVVRYSQMSKAVTIAFKHSAGERDAMDHWANLPVLAGIYQADWFTQGGFLGWFWRRLPAQ